jgi:hypothetical protein
MATATLTGLEHAGVSERPKIATAYAGYWREEMIDEVISCRLRGRGPLLSSG